MTHKSRATIAAVALLMTAGVVMAIPSISRIRRQSRISECTGHLHTLWHLRSQYTSSNDDRLIPNGGQYFLLLEQVRPLRVKQEIFYCPLSDEERIPGRTSYRGPAFPVRKLLPEDPCAADKEGNHGSGQGGNVVTKMGDVKEVGASDPLWIRARVTTKE